MSLTDKLTKDKNSPENKSTGGRKTLKLIYTGAILWTTFVWGSIFHHEYNQGKIEEELQNLNKTNLTQEQIERKKELKDLSNTYKMIDNLPLPSKPLPHAIVYSILTCGIGYHYHRKKERPSNSKG